MLHLDYGNDDSVNYNYDDQGRLILETFEDGDTVSYTYNSYGNLATVMDSETGITTAHYYDFIDRLVKYRETGGGRSHSVNYIYDSENNLSQLKETIDGTVHTTDYGYNKDNRVTSVTNGTASEHYTYDGLGRIDRIVTTNTAANAEVLEKSYTFRNPSATTTSTQIATNSIQATIGELTEDDLYYDPDPYVFDVTYSYTYDDNGNILSISDGTNTTSYEYDSANQLIRENNQELGFTHTWEYDNVGNILNRKEYAYTTGSLDDLEPEEAHEMSGYGMRAMGDLFAEYDGVVMSYDAIGNPLYDGEWTYTWEHGRELKTMSRGGYDNWSFAYDANGMRTRRTHPDIEYQYIYNGSQLSQLTVLETGGGGLAVNVLYFTYSADGTPLTVTSEGQLYFYVTNMQGDVIAILDDTGRVVCRYIYDAWGNVTTDSWTTDLVVYHNPLRYRGYVYDEETGLYYVSSRYYDSEIGRWINADNQLSTGSDLTGLNLFAYCGNNPVNRIDPTGEAWWHWALGAAVVAVAAVATVVTCGGFAAAATAVCMVGSGVAAATTASTVAAGAFIGSATVYGMAVLSAASTSNSVQEFNDQGNWGTVAATAFGGLTGGYDGYTMSKAQTPTSSPTNISRGSTGRTEPANLREQLAMEQVKSNPSAGTQLTRITLNDPRWPSSEGWVKMQQIVPTSQGNINIHYVYNQTLKIFDDFKFKP